MTFFSSYFPIIREIAFIRSLTRRAPDLKYYYMGFYLHNCPKMRYKGQYVPSYISCPESYKWVAIDKCRPKLDKSKYSRLEEDGVGMYIIFTVYRFRCTLYVTYSYTKTWKKSGNYGKRYLGTLSQSIKHNRCDPRIN